jgi:hypothetical protein
VATVANQGICWIKPIRVEENRVPFFRRLWTIKQTFSRKYMIIMGYVESGEEVQKAGVRIEIVISLA